MEETETTPAAGTAQEPKRPRNREALNGRVDILVGEQVVAALAIQDGAAKLADAAAGAESPRATLVCRSRDHLERMLRGDLNLIVASLRGDLQVRGDSIFAIQALRAMQSDQATARPSAPAPNQAPEQTPKQGG